MHIVSFCDILESVGRHSLVAPRPANIVVIPMERACRKRPSRLRVEGPLARYLEPYAEYLADQGYSQISYWKKTFLVSEFSRWLGKNKIPAEEITTDHEEAFLRYSARKRCAKNGDRIAISGVTNWLQEQGVLQLPSETVRDTSEIDRVLQEYRAYLREERGLASATIDNYAGSVRRFLTCVYGDEALRLTELRAKQITDFIRGIAPRDRTFAAAKHMVTALRSFLRFARYRDYVQTDLAACVPSVAGWSMASIPRAMPSDCVRRLLDESKKWRTPVGLRNRAILLLLARLGLRAREIVLLELDDIDWSEGWLKVHGKGRHDRPLPMPHDVGRSLADYLRDGRPAATSRRVFLRSRAPFDGLKGSTDISVMVQRALRRTGIELPCMGSHQLRHALAVDMLRQGLSFTEIGQLLRHRSPDATRRYAKIDLDALREVALPWPGELP